ncbi:hypothetical protein [Cyclobacterium plantarum]|uniref:hypothetical protein n=1 Tax=Cyclobacterium plantarum TaxID=2716263 RepID=UPI003F6E68C3
MNSVKEGFELLDSLGISREVQELFSAGLREDASGRLITDYRDEKGRVVDQEILAVTKQKLSSCGILHLSPALPENVRTLYISDAIMHLIFMVQRKIHRIDFSYAAFLVSGARMDRELIEKRMDQYPECVKIYTLFGHSLIGRIRDCKVQDWLKGSDGSFRVAGNKVVAQFKGKEFWMKVGEFSLRNHCRQVGLRQTVSTCKPVDKNIYNFYLFS